MCHVSYLLQNATVSLHNATVITKGICSKFNNHNSFSDLFKTKTFRQKKSGSRNYFLHELLLLLPATVVGCSKYLLLELDKNLVYFA